MNENQKIKKGGSVKQYPSECTSILVGKSMMADGSMIAARSEDWDAMFAKNMEMFKAKTSPRHEFVALDSPFKCELPSSSLGYTALSPYHLHGHWGSAGFNDAGVGMSATESIFSSDKVLEHDPLLPDGVGENSVFNIVLPYIYSAREGVERLGMLIEKHGTCEGFGVAFVDSKELWYLETASGHRWLACRIPDKVYFVTGNQSRFRDYDPNDHENFMASDDLIEFAQSCGLYDPKKGPFDFHEAYAHDEKLDTTYNYPRVWGLQQMFSPQVKNDVTKNTFPVFAEADHLLTLEDLKKAFRFHYQDTEHDPYLHSNPKEPYRPVSIFRTTQTHILQVRPDLPKEIGEINYVALGMADLGVFIPIYQGMTEFPESYTKGTNVSSPDSAYWKFRKVQALGMVNYNRYAPRIQLAYLEWEANTAQRQVEFEREYLQLFEGSPMEARQLLQEFGEGIMQSAIDLADELTEELFTLLTQDIQEEYLFHGA